VTLGDMTVPGHLRMNFLVYPDGRVAVPSFVAWMEDLDLAVNLLWWEVDREPLRCTSFRNAGGLEGTLEGSDLVIPAGAAVSGRSYTKRNSRGRCEGEPRILDVKSPDEIRASHNPESDHFALVATFEPPADEAQGLAVTLEVEGHYLNRPPVAALEVSGEGVSTALDGCPSTRKGDPPIALANTPQGLEVTLRSLSTDPDGLWPGEDHPKGLRVDLSFEQWSRTRDGGFSFLGAGQEIGPVVFETGREHQLLLWVIDRRGAEARKVCRFQVVEPN